MPAKVFCHHTTSRRITRSPLLSGRFLTFLLACIKERFFEERDFERDGVLLDQLNPLPDLLCRAPFASCRFHIIVFTSDLSTRKKEGNNFSKATRERILEDTNTHRDR